MRSTIPRRALLLSLLASVALAPATAGATSLLELRYDSRSDMLVAKIAFRGTHRDHAFSVRWGECGSSPNDPSRREVAGLIVDAHGFDAARTDYLVGARFGLSDIPCRPAAVTLRTTAGSIRTVHVPRVSAAKRRKSSDRLTSERCRDDQT